MNDANLAQQEVQDNTDFLVGDVVVLSDLNLLSVTELLTLHDFDGEFWTTDHSIGRVSEKVIRTATTAELQAKGYLGDLEKYNEATMMGYQVIRFSTEQVKSGKAIEQIEKMVGDLG